MALLVVSELSGRVDQLDVCLPLAKIVVFEEFLAKIRGHLTVLLLQVVKRFIAKLKFEPAFRLLLPQLALNWIESLPEDALSAASSDIEHDLEPVNDAAYADHLIEQHHVALWIVRILLFNPERDDVLKQP